MKLGKYEIDYDNDLIFFDNQLLCSFTSFKERVRLEQPDLLKKHTLKSKLAIKPNGDLDIRRIVNWTEILIEIYDS